jgi:opacity protein-like surface antigen
MRHARAFAFFAVLAVLAAPAKAFADATLFLGANMSPANRTAKGLAIGVGLLFVGFEFEYSDTTDDLPSRSPALKSGMGNVLLQTPGDFFGIQPYFTVGGGVYHEDLSTTSTVGTTTSLIDNTGFGMNTGGGVKINLIGPIRLRVDYRVFSLKQNANTSPAHRIYAGINLKF